MLNQEVLNKMNDSEKTDYAKLGEDYWQAADEVNFGENDSGWLLEQGTNLDELKKILVVQDLRTHRFEQRMRNKYIYNCKD